MPRSKKGIVVCERKYALDVLEETCMTECRPVDNPMDPNKMLMANQGEPLSDKKTCWETYLSHYY